MLSGVRFPHSVITGRGVYRAELRERKKNNLPKLNAEPYAPKPPMPGVCNRPLR